MQYVVYIHAAVSHRYECAHLFPSVCSVFRGLGMCWWLFSRRLSSSTNKGANAFSIVHIKMNPCTLCTVCPHVD
jgi:hypothetical protein